MNGVQIATALLSDPIVKNIFVGVFAADHLPNKEYPGGYIINTDTSDKPGQHWVAFYTEVPGRLEGFDSFGRNPSYYSELIKKWVGDDFLTISNAQHQSNDSTVCGQYRIFFILLRSHGFKYEDVMSALIKNRVINDKFVCKFVNKYFRLRTTIKNEKFIISSLPQYQK